MRPTVAILCALALGACVDSHGAIVTVEQQYAVGGLFRNANPFGKAPPGAMLRAEEVVYRRPGMAEPRPGFKAGVATPLQSIYKLIPFDDSVLHVGPDPGNGTSNTYWPPSTEVEVNSGPLEWDRSAIRGLEARGNLYLTTRDIPRRLTSSTDAAAIAVGLVPPVVVSAISSGVAGFLPDGSSVAYRATLELTLSSGLVITSAPSGRVVYFNNAGGTRSPSVSVVAHGYPNISGAKVLLKVYRTEPAATDDPGDEMFLSFTVNLTGTSALTLASYADTTLDANLGEELYTNGSTNGVLNIARANIRPPAAKDIALFQGSVFLSNLTRQARKTLRYLEGGDRSASATGIGRRTYTGTRTNTSNQITGLSSTTGLQVGMVLSVATSWGGTDAVRITAIVGSDLTMSEAWGGATDGAPVSLTFVDAIAIGGSYYRADNARWIAEGMSAGFDAASGRSLKSTTAFAFSPGDLSYSIHTTMQNAKRPITIEAISALTTLTIRATHGDEYDPPIPLASATAENVAPEAIPNGYMWSKNGEPEHFMLAAIDRAGHQNSEIRRMFATRDAIWMLKGPGDGLYRLSGFGELEGWREDKFDSDTFLVHHELACSMNDSVFAWTNKGMVSIGDGGVIPLSGPFIGADTREFEVDLATDPAANGGFFGVANPVDSELIFGVPPDDAAEATAAHHVYVYSLRTRDWSKWFVGLSVYTSGVFDASAGRLIFGRNDSGTPRVERGAAETAVKADREFSVTIATVTGTAVTINGGSGWTPAVGDMITRSGVFMMVTAIASATAFTVHTTGLATGAGTAYEAYTSRLSWLPKVGPGGSAVKLWQYQLLHWDDTRGLYSWSVIASGSGDQATETTYSDTRDYQRAAQRHDNTRMFFSRAVALNVELYPTLQIKQADARWRLAGMSLAYEPVSAQVRR